jgi:hypothetical protein
MDREIVDRNVSSCLYTAKAFALIRVINRAVERDKGGRNI